MTIALACLTCVGFTVAVCAVAFAHSVLADAATERAGYRATIDMLCQRIQAPDQAVSEHFAQTAMPDPQPVDLEDDDAMYAAREERLNGY